jgi:hypothetical protein
MLFAIFVAYPWLALIPAAGFLVLHLRAKRGLAAALLWLLYGMYEYAMHRRWLCSGECNIRVDLLLIYPILWIVSGVALWRAFRRNAR